MKHALDKLKLFVSIDVRYSEAGWYADVILPEATYLERANILCQMGGPVPSFYIRDQAIAPRFDSRPAWWIFREILRRMDALAPSAKDALDFETIEELWNYQLNGTGVTVAELREQGFVSLANAPRLMPARGSQVPDPLGKIEIESAILQQAGLPSMPPYTVKAVPAEDSFLLLIGRTATLTHGQSFNNPLLNERAPEQVLWIHPDRAWPLGIGDGDAVEIRGGGSYTGRIKAHVTPWIHPETVFMLHGFGATVPLARRALGRGVADQRLQDGKLYDFDTAGGGCALTETVVRIKSAVAGGGNE